MDKFNVIEPTTDLDQLNLDITNWCALPFDMRMRSNDDCMRMYQCTVPELYNRMKASIMYYKDKENLDNDNVISESVNCIVNMTNDEKYSERLNKSEELNNNPCYIIITPDITSTEVLNWMYNRFNGLSYKFQTLSNYYSQQIWGFSVTNMYNMVYANLEDEDIDKEDNINIKESYNDIENICCSFGNIVETILIDKCLHGDEFALYEWMINNYDEINSYSVLAKSISGKIITNALESCSCEGYMIDKVPEMTVREYINDIDNGKININSSIVRLKCTNDLDKIRIIDLKHLPIIPAITGENMLDQISAIIIKKNNDDTNIKISIKPLYRDDNKEITLITPGKFNTNSYSDTYMIYISKDLELLLNNVLDNSDSSEFYFDNLWANRIQINKFAVLENVKYDFLKIVELLADFFKNRLDIVDFKVGFSHKFYRLLNDNLDKAKDIDRFLRSDDELEKFIDDNYTLENDKLYNLLRVRESFRGYLKR